MKEITYDEVIPSLMWGSYKANRNEGMTHEALVKLGIGTEAMKERYNSIHHTLKPLTMKVLSTVDLGKSFDRLKDDLKESVSKTKGETPERYAEAFGFLETAVKRHLLNCTDEYGEDLQKYIAETKR